MGFYAAAYWKALIFDNQVIKEVAALSNFISLKICV